MSVQTDVGLNYDFTPYLTMRLDQSLFSSCRYVGTGISPCSRHEHEATLLDDVPWLTRFDQRYCKDDPKNSLCLTDHFNSISSYTLVVCQLYHISNIASLATCSLPARSPCSPESCLLKCPSTLEYFSTPFPHRTVFDLMTSPTCQTHLFLQDYEWDLRFLNA